MGLFGRLHVLTWRVRALGLGFLGWLARKIGLAHEEFRSYRKGLNKLL